MTVEKYRRVVMDIDGVLVQKDNETPYSDREPNSDVLSKLQLYHKKGFYIILFTARNMNTYEGRIGKIQAETAPILLNWLADHEVPYDEIHYGKPWCGHEGFYVDDRAIRPSEFVTMSRDEVSDLLQFEQDTEL
jgi:capsule biosynthesis phosphatase